jgi:hypothetical protein
MYLEQLPACCCIIEMFQNAENRILKLCASDKEFTEAARILISIEAKRCLDIL